MATPVNDSYSVASSGTIYGGRNPLVPAWVSALPLWQWYSIPNTALQSVEPSPTTGFAGNSGPSAKIGSWCGATLKRSGSIYMLGAAGGHQDYYGNEVDAITLNTVTPAWTELRTHSAVVDMYNLVSVYNDGRKSSEHTYWSTQFDNVNNRMMICSPGGPNGTLPAAPGGYAYNTPSSGNTPDPFVTCAFDMATNDWTSPTLLGLMPYALSTADFCCANPLTSEIFINKDQAGTMYKFSPSTGNWTSVGSWFLNGGYAGGAVDPTRHHILVVGDFGGTRAPDVRSTVDASQVSVTWGGLGSSALQLTGYPGLIYDEANDNFLVAVNGASNIDIIRVDAATFNVDRPTISNTIANRPNGIHNSFQYVPELKGVVIANSYTGNMQFMRTHL